MKRIFYILLAGIGMMGCTSAPKHLAKAIQKDKQYVMAELRRIAPCIETVNGKPDSTAYKQYLKDLQSIQDFYNSQEPQRVTDTLEIAWTDSAKIISLQAQLAKQKAYIADLLKICRDKPPIHDTTYMEDSAKIYLLLNNTQVLQGVNDGLTVDNKKKNDSRDWWRKWCLITWGGLGLAGIGWALLKKFKPL